jgi:CspA family cold shock protein
MKGNVKWYNNFKGYGFISGEDGKDVFVHSTALPIGTELNDNDSVEYTIEEGERGPKATNVKKSKDN